MSGVLENDCGAVRYVEARADRRGESERKRHTGGAAGETGAAAKPTPSALRGKAISCIEAGWLSMPDLPECGCGTRSGPHYAGEPGWKRQARQSADAVQGVQPEQVRSADVDPPQSWIESSWAMGRGEMVTGFVTGSSGG